MVSKYWQNIVRAFSPDKESVEINKSDLLDGLKKQDVIIKSLDETIEDVKSEINKSCTDEALYSLRKYVSEKKEQEELKKSILEEYQN